jgi:2-iminobutanoate/2-iminopropanoate deaminase
VKANGSIFLSGQLAKHAGGNIVGADVQAQTRFVLERIAATLQEAGSSMADVVKAKVKPCCYSSRQCRDYRPPS